MQHLTDPVAIGRRIRACRKDLGLSVEALAHETDISASFLSNIERGSKIASLETLARLCVALDADLHYLVLGRSASVRPDFELRQAIHDLAARFP